MLYHQFYAHIVLPCPACNLPKISDWPSLVHDDKFSCHQDKYCFLCFTIALSLTSVTGAMSRTVHTKSHCVVVAYPLLVQCQELCTLSHTVWSLHIILSCDEWKCFSENTRTIYHPSRRILIEVNYIVILRFCGTQSWDSHIEGLLYLY
jgi:hypothetical protein